MGKLHELLAVEADLAAQAKRTLSRVKDLFANPHKFVGQVASYRQLEEGGRPFADEITNRATTVNAELAAVFADFTTWTNASLQKEVTNQTTAADVVVDGTILAVGLPATALLNLENKLASLKEVLTAIPTNDVTERWNWDDQQLAWVSEPRITYRTEKVMKTHVAYPATPEHPAQTQVYHEDVRVGEWRKVISSGMYQPNQKRDMLARLDKLTIAVKQARQRANDVEIVDVQVAADLVKYLIRE